MDNPVTSNQLTNRKTIHDRIWVVVAILLLAAISVLLQIRWSPSNHKIHVDGTVFAYGGERILNGDIPYRDFWDHKPPGVFYLNALAFWLFGVDAWSVWFLTVVWTIAISLVFYYFLAKLVPRHYAVLGSVVLLATVLQPRFYEGANLTEFYGLLPTIFSLYFLHNYLTHRRSASLIALGGAFTAGAILKHTNVATALVCIGIIAFVEFRSKGFSKAVKVAFLFSVPFILTIAFIALYWESAGGLQDIWQATVEYNLLYINQTWGIKSVYGVIRSTAADPSVGPLFILVLGGALAYWSSRKEWKKHHRTEKASDSTSEFVSDWTYFGCFSAIILETLFISFAGRGFGHYYITLMPAICASASYWFRTTSSPRHLSNIESKKQHKPPPLAIAGFVVWMIVTFGLVRPSIGQIRTFILDAAARRPLRTNVGKIVSNETGPDDTVLIWEIGAEINFETARKAPSRYVYFLPLFQPGFQNEQRWNEFLDDLEINQPALIISQWQRGYAPQFDASVEDLASRCRCDGDILAGFTAFANFITSNYERELLFGNTFAVYRLTNP